MEDNKKVITLDDIKTYLLRNHVKSAICLLFLILFWSLLVFVANYLSQAHILYILAAVGFLSGVIGVIIAVIQIARIKNNSYFTIMNHVLVDKKDHRSSGVWPGGQIANRLVFRFNKYDIPKKSGRYDIYNMEPQAIFDTAVIGDTFTLVKVKKQVVLAFNNKLFNVITD